MSDGKGPRFARFAYRRAGHAPCLSSGPALRLNALSRTGDPSGQIHVVSQLPAPQGLWKWATGLVPGRVCASATGPSCDRTMDLPKDEAVPISPSGARLPWIGYLIRTSLRATRNGEVIRRIPERRSEFLSLGFLSEKAATIEDFSLSVLADWPGAVGETPRRRSR